MSETEMVERVARAIRAKVPMGYGMTDAEALEYARAAIEAMREPTEQMIRARIDRRASGYSLPYERIIALDYNVMIDAALTHQSDVKG